MQRREYSLFSEFKEQYLSGRDFVGTYLRYGEQLYLGMCEMPSLKGLKALRPGLHLGTFKKNRFEPSHALALALKPEEVKQVVELSFSEAEQYISGMTITVNDQTKGWCLVCVDGYSLGWGKVTGNVMKNHYPKGLRIPMVD
ncbi:MAG: RsmF rRNA methyltransferase first C-terminal domain-containing protein [Lachnospiraceae bacterium]|nr:RsmF rRNA methyltransferase first C-terminal domain-containing protein [Lachnospiraceae bacterium]